MTPDKKAILEYAAKACGIKGYYVTDEIGIKYTVGQLGSFKPRYFNPIDNALDTSAMCARLEIDTIWTDTAVICADDSREHETEVRHDGTDASKEAAWRLAVSMVGAKVGGYQHEQL